MTPEEEANMLNDDLKCWKRAKGFHVSDITDCKTMNIMEQLDVLIMDWKSMLKYNTYNKTVFSMTRPLYIDWENRVPLCTKDEEHAKLWLFQINKFLSEAKKRFINDHKTNNIDYNKIYTIRCVSIDVNPIEGDWDKSIAGVHYFGLIVSHYGSERNNIDTITKQCDDLFHAIDKETNI